MIGPRSALFTPFPKLGLIIIDEEHEGAYQSETAPRYDARETAAVRARMNGASLILGSATPSVESYYRAEQGEYRLLRLTKRAKEHSRLAGVHVADLREELSEGNRSVFSRQLTALIKDRLQKKRADHAVYEPERLCQLRFLPFLRQIGEMPPLRRISHVP